MNDLNQKTIGLLLTIFGTALFIMLMGPLLFKMIGGMLALLLINQGLLMQGLPGLNFYLLNLLNLKR